MSNRIIRLCVLFLIVPFLDAVAQVNNPVVRVQVEQGQTLEDIELFSLDNIVTIKAFSENESGGGFTTIIENPGKYELRYTARTDFEGVDFGVFECTESLFGPKSYVTIEIEVVKSILIANDDFFELEENNPSIAIAPLLNDSSSSSNIHLVSLENSFGGQIQLNDDGLVEFKVEENFSGLANFSYIIEDDAGSTDAASVFINVNSKDIAKSDTIHIVHASSDPLLINLPGFNFELDESSDLIFGHLDLNSPFSVIYKTDSYVVGEEMFTLSNPDGLSRHYVIEMVQGAEVQSILVDDIAYTSRGQYVAIDAIANDYRNNGVVIDYSDDLIYSSGLFAYIPDSDFEGVKEFYYTVHDGQRSYTASIDVYVSDYMPAITDYTFEVKKNIPLVLEYNVPIRNYRFNIINAPDNGVLAVNQNTHGANSCTRAEGYQMIAYTPNENYMGDDSFVLEYCVLEGSCVQIEVDISVVDTEDDCGCSGPDCVWSGDTNHDGVVNISDLLPIGLHYGESGTERNSVDANWGAEKVEDWMNEQIHNQNAKHIDANGDGLISVADTAGIINNYNSFDNIVASNNILNKSIPIRFIFDQTEIQNGDEISIDIQVGSESDPVIDLHGIALPIRIPPSLLNEDTSIEFVPNNNWLGSNSPIIHLSQSANVGQIDVGVVRTSDVGISGSGSVGTLNITIGVDVDELRPDEPEVPMDIEIPSTVIVDGSGQQYALEGTSLRVMVQLKEQTVNNQSIITDDIDVLISPNPSNGGIVSIHANNDDELVELSIYTLIGERLSTHEGINSNHFDLNVDLPQGMYLAQIKTIKGTTTQKIEVIK